MKRIVKRDLLRKWATGKLAANVKLAALADISPETARKVLNGECPKTQKVRIKISSAIGVDEDDLFPLNEDDLAA